MSKKDPPSGFTLVELMLSMTFVSVLLISIAILAIQVSEIYNRGMTLKAVNQAGTSISYDLQRAINSTPADSIQFDEVNKRLCLGTFTYVWNDGTDIQRKQKNPSVISLTNKYRNEESEIIRFAKVYDSGGSLCSSRGDGVEIAPVSDIEKGDGVTAELLKTSDRDLVVNDVNVERGMDGDVVTVSFSLSTATIDALDGQGGCKPPADNKSDLTYCAINKFEVTAVVDGRK